MNFGIAIHGGAGNITRASVARDGEEKHIEALNAALDAGYAILQNGGSALDPVEAAVRCMEDCPFFNAGKGSVFNSKGEHEMDASIMWGKDLSTGAVAMVKNIKNPVSLARVIMEKSGPVFLAGEGAEDFARRMNLKFEPDDYFFDSYRYEQWLAIQNKQEAQLDHNATPVHNKDKKHGTVGAAALDRNGNLAAATSTGGMTNKKYSRIGDSPIIGAGTYANNNTCAVSCTGEGEFFIRSVVAHDVSCLMEYKKISLREACAEAMKKLKHIGGEGGIAAIDKNGDIEFIFNTPGMYRAMKNSKGKSWAAIFK